MKNLLKVTFLVYILFNSLTYAVTNELYLWDFVCDDNNCDTTSKKEISVTSAGKYFIPNNDVYQEINSFKGYIKDQLETKYGKKYGNIKVNIKTDEEKTFICENRYCSSFGIMGGCNEWKENEVNSCSNGVCFCKGDNPTVSNEYVGCSKSQENDKEFTCKKLGEYKFIDLLDKDDDKKIYAQSNLSNGSFGDTISYVGGESYWTNGLEYILNNFSFIVGKYNEGIPMTGNIPSTDITSLDKNIISYNKNNNEWNLKRVCKSITCIPTYSKKINFDNDSDTVYLLRGEEYNIEGNFQYEIAHIGELSVSQNVLFAGEKAGVKFEFDSRLSNGDYTDFEYKVFANEVQIFSEKIRVKKGSPYSTADSILIWGLDEDGDGMWKSLSDADFGGTISIEELSENIVKLTIIENKLFVQSGNSNLSMKVKNITSNYEIETSESALTSIQVFPSNSLGETEIYYASSLFDNDNTVGFHMNRHIALNIKFKDDYGNPFCDNQNGIYLYLTDYNLSGKGKTGLEICNTPSNCVNHDDSINLKTNDSCSSTFYIKPTTAGTFKNIKFKVQARSKKAQSEVAYKSPIEDIYGEDIFPKKNQDGVEITNVDVNPNGIYATYFQCWNQNIPERFVYCSYDIGLSGCAYNPSDEKEKLLWIIQELSAGRRKLDNSYENTLKQALNDETFESATFSFNQVRMAIRRAIRQDYGNLVNNCTTGCTLERLEDLFTSNGLTGSYNSFKIELKNNYDVGSIDVPLSSTTADQYKSTLGLTDTHFQKTSLGPFDVESDNVSYLQTGTILIRDNADNTKEYERKMNTIDKKGPKITLTNGGSEIDSNFKTKAGTGFVLEILEETAGSCVSEANFQAIIKIDGNIIEQGIIGRSGGYLHSVDGTKLYTDGTFNGGNSGTTIQESSGIKRTLDLSPWLSKVKLGDGAIVPHVIEIIDLKDRYGNTVAGKTYNITIYPTDEDLFGDTNGDGIADLLCDGLVGNGCCDDDNKVKFYSLNSPIEGSVYANNSNTYDYELTLNDKFCNPITGKSLNSIGQDSNLTGIKTICLDETLENATCSIEDSALTFIKDSTNTDFQIRSYTPGSFTQAFELSMNLWNNDYISSSESKELKINLGDMNSFKKPIAIQNILVSNSTGALQSTKCNDPTYWNDKMELGALQSYKIVLSNSGNFSTNSGILYLNTSNIKDPQRNRTWFNDEFIGEILDFSENLGNACIGFIGKTEDNFGSLEIKNGNPNITEDDDQINDLPITYELGGKNVSYYLDQFTKTGACQNKSTLGVKVIGTLQSDGKADQTGQEENFSDLSTAEMRGIIKKNATQLTRGMTSNKDKVINGVKYVTENITIDGPQSYETLIVKNGNVYISSNVSSNSGKPLGIIVLKDNYDVKNDWNNAGNVYVSANVRQIDAIIYADGALRSAKDETGTKYGDNEDDNYLLKYTSDGQDNTLDIRGSLFTRNTIGGAVKLDDDYYLLPGGVKTDDYELAKEYDLNYVRRVSLCAEDDYAVKITYDSRIQTNPPKGFSR